MLCSLLVPFLRCVQLPMLSILQREQERERKKWSIWYYVVQSVQLRIGKSKSSTHKRGKALEARARAAARAWASTWAMAGRACSPLVAVVPV